MYGTYIQKKTKYNRDKFGTGKKLLGPEKLMKLI